MDLSARLRVARVHTAPFAEVVRRMRQTPMEMLDFGAVPTDVSPFAGIYIDSLMRAARPETVLKACSGVGGVHVTSSALVIHLVVKGVHPAVYMFPLRVTPDLATEAPLPVKFLKLAVVDAAMCNSVPMASLWNGKMHTFARVPKMHARAHEPLEAGILDAMTPATSDPRVPSPCLKKCLTVR